MDIEFALQRLPQTLVVVSGNGVADEQVPQQFGVIVSGLVTDRNNVNLFGDNHIALFFSDYGRSIHEWLAVMMVNDVKEQCVGLPPFLSDTS